MRNCWPNREGWERGDRFNGAGVGGYFLGGKPPIVKSVQRGTITLAGVTSNTATITSVDTANSKIRFLGFDDNNAADAAQQSSCAVALTNATTVTLSKTNAAGGSTTIASYEVIEYNAGILKSVQRGTITMNGVASNTATITSVDTTRLEMGYLGQKISTATTQKEWSYLVLTNATTVTATRTSALAADSIIGYEVDEFNP